MTMEHHHGGGGGPVTPLHPAVVHFPIALSVLSVGADTAGWLARHHVLAASLFATGWWTLAGAIVSAGVAILLGIFDMRRATIADDTHRRVHHHMRVGFAVFVMLAVLFGWRVVRVLGGEFSVGPAYLALGLLEVLLIAYQGWLGGELVFRYRVSVAAGEASDENHTSDATHTDGAHKMDGRVAVAEKGVSAKDSMAGMPAMAAVDSGADTSGKHDMAGMPGMAGKDDMAGMAQMENTKTPADPSAHGQRQVTRAQLVAMTVCSFLVLIAGLYAPATRYNLSLSAEQVGRAIMPPGMINTPETSADAMRDMAAVDPRLVSWRAPADARGDRPLAPRMEGDVKVFDLDASVIQWNILAWKTVTAYAINRQVPGPRLELTDGDHVRINFTNHLPDHATMHWHGLIVPNQMDGPAHITQAPVPPGGHYTYEFVVQQSGSYFYHSHMQPDRQQAFGLYGALIIKPRVANVTEKPVDIDYVVQLQEWLNRDGLTYPAMLMEGGLPNYFTINGKSYPATETIHMRVGQRVKFRIIGTNNNFIHPMHMHGGPFTVVARDGVDLSPGARFDADVINVGPGQRYDIVWPARVAGKWIFHCHIAHHTLNNNREEQGGGGLTLLVDVAP